MQGIQIQLLLQNAKHQILNLNIYSIIYYFIEGII